MSRDRQNETRTQYSLSVLAAISQSDILGIQVVEGGSDLSNFEHFIYKVVQKIRTDKKTMDKPVVVFLDNAAVHKSPMIQHLATKMRVTFLYASQYSPWQMSVEQLFNSLKRTVKSLDPKPTR